MLPGGRGPMFGFLDKYGSRAVESWKKKSQSRPVAMIKSRQYKFTRVAYEKDRREGCKEGKKG